MKGYEGEDCGEKVRMAGARGVGYKVRGRRGRSAKGNGEVKGKEGKEKR